MTGWDGRSDFAIISQGTWIGSHYERIVDVAGTTGDLPDRSTLDFADHCSYSTQWVAIVRIFQFPFERRLWTKIKR
jgi:hypothetical protein